MKKIAVGLLGLFMLVTVVFSGSCSSNPPASPATPTPTPLPSVSTLCTFTTAQPYYLAVDSQGNVYATTNNSTILKCTSAGVTSTYASSLTDTIGIAVDSSGNLYVADEGAKAVLKITSTTVTALGGSFSFNEPYAVALNSAATTLLISDVGADGVDALVLGSNTVSSVITSENSVDGLAYDANGNLYQTQGAYNCLIYVPSNFTSESVYAGSGTPGSANGALTSARFSDPLQIAMDSHGNIYVADNGNSAIRLVSTSGSTVSTLVGPSSMSPTVTQTLSSPTGVAVDGSGNVYFCAGYNIYKYKP
jgi:serine/threonine protein kinase, bacterial